MKYIIKSKKSQYYLFVALLLSSFFVINNYVSTYKENKLISTDVSENFVQEISYVINSAIYNEINIKTQLESFYDFYKDYALTRRLDFNLIFLLRNQNQVYVYNSLDNSIFIEPLSNGYEYLYELKPNENIELPYSDMRVKINSFTYDYYFNENIDLKYLIIQKIRA